MNRHASWFEIAILPLTVATVILLAVLLRPEPVVEKVEPALHESIPDFAAIRDVKKKKRQFFEFMIPRVRAANDAVLAERRIVQRVLKALEAGTAPAEADIEKLPGIFGRYRLKHSSPPTTDELTSLVRRVDAVPASLILAQAANESAWGTSRFAQEGRNFFGIWCFTPGCGLTPRFRDDGLTHEVRRFDTVQESVGYYLLMINTNGAYRDLREMRSNLRTDSAMASGIQLAEGLVRYSERGIDYVREIQAMIRFNSLQRYNRFSTAPVAE